MDNCKKCEDKKRKKRNKIDHVKSEYQLKRIYRESYNCDNYQEGKKKLNEKINHIATIFNYTSYESIIMITGLIRKKTIIIANNVRQVEGRRCVAY